MWSWIVGNGPGLSATAALATTLVALWGIRRAVLDGSERSRPVVIAEFRQAPEADDMIELVVRNAGVSIARDLQVCFDPGIGEPDAEPRQRSVAILKRRYSKKIATVAPGQALTNLWWATDFESKKTQDLPNYFDLPYEVVVSVSYRGNRRKQYTDEFRMSVGNVTDKTYAVGSTSTRSRIGAIKDSAESIAKSMQTLAMNSSRDPDRRL